MKRLLILFYLVVVVIAKADSQSVLSAATQFINSLDAEQKAKAVYPFDTDDRYNFYYFPVTTRKGVPLREMNSTQKKATLKLIESCMSEKTAQKVQDIMQLEKVLKVIENRKPEDNHRDPDGYYFTIFGVPGDKTVWGWRLDGHHICFNFSVNNNKLVSGTPGFLGSNPGIVQDGDQKGKEVLKTEKEMGFDLLNSLSADQLKKAIVDTSAPADIITKVVRKVTLENPSGIRYSEMTAAQKEKFLQLVNLYVHRYTKLFADEMLKEIQSAGLDNLWFSWYGRTKPGIGNPHYYRIQGPSLIIEYDNTQNNANHVHTVVRDLKNDFGGDMLMEHYKASH